MHLRLVRATPVQSRRITHSDDERPSLAVAFAWSVALALFIGLTVLTKAARAQTAATSATASASTAAGASNASPKTANKAPVPPKTETSIGGAIRQSADRHGLWGSVGLGRAGAGLQCNACVRETTHAYAVHGIIGIRLSSRFLVGAESFGWMDVMGGGTDRVARGTYLIARTYPFEGSSMFLHGGLGQASFHTTDGEVAFTTRSPSLSLSAGYDWRVGEFTLTPALTAVTSTGGKLTSDRTDNAVTDNARLRMLRTSVAISWFR